MSTTIDLDWAHYGLIADLAERMQRQQFSFGKTALQKLVYFLQEIHGVDCGYEFTLYTYGPFSSALLGDLDSARTLGAVDVDYISSSGGYQISPGKKSATFREKAIDFLGENAEAFDKVVNEFGSMWAKALELRATIVYVERDARASGREPSDAELVDTVRGLKPHFDEATIEAAIRELRDKNYLR